MNGNHTELIIYQTEDGRTKINVRMEAAAIILTNCWSASVTYAPPKKCSGGRCRTKCSSPLPSIRRRNLSAGGQTRCFRRRAF